MSGAPQVTVLVPVYNAARYLRESLDSVLAQEHPSFEVVVLDDCSTDGSADVLREYAQRVRVLRWERNLGQFRSQNAGLQQVRSPYVAVYHADDVYDPRLLSAEVAFLEAHPTVGAVFASDVWTDADGVETGRLRLPPDVPADVPLGHAEVLTALLRHKNTFLRCPSLLVRREVHEVVGDYRPDPWGPAADLDMFVRISERYDLAVLGEHLFRYRRHGGAVNVQRVRTQPEHVYRMLDEHLTGCPTPVPRDALRDFDAHRAEDWLMVAVGRYVAGDRPGAREALRAARVRDWLRSRRVQRSRLLLLALLVRALLVLPSNDRVVGLLGRRYATRS